MNPMIVLTVKRDGGTQDVLGFFKPTELPEAIHATFEFLKDSQHSRRAIARIELYNPEAPPPHS